MVRFRNVHVYLISNVWYGSDTCELEIKVQTRNKMLQLETFMATQLRTK